MSIQKTDWGEISWLDEEKKQGLQTGIVTLQKDAHQPKHIHYEEQSIYVLRAVGWNFTGNEVVDTILAYLHEHYAEKIELDTLAQITYCTESHIARVFKKHTGTTIISYLCT